MAGQRRAAPHARARARDQQRRERRRPRQLQQRVRALRLERAGQQQPDAAVADRLRARVQGGIVEEHGPSLPAPWRRVISNPLLQKCSSGVLTTGRRGERKLAAMNSHLTPRLTAGLCSAAIGVLGFAAPAMAQTPASTISIGDCHVQRSPTSHVVWFDCGVTADNATNVSAHYRTNLATSKPKTVGPWSSRSGTVAFKGGGQQISTLKFAVRNQHLTVRQVEQRVRVTLSNAKGGTITDGVATAGPAATPTAPGRRRTRCAPGRRRRTRSGCRPRSRRRPAPRRSATRCTRAPVPASPSASPSAARAERSLPTSASPCCARASRATRSR